jgi:hypothetical protein
MYHIPSEIICLIALELKISDLYNVSCSSTRLNNSLMSNKAFIEQYTQRWTLSDHGLDFINAIPTNNWRYTCYVCQQSKFVKYKMIGKNSKRWIGQIKVYQFDTTITLVNRIYKILDRKIIKSICIARDFNKSKFYDNSYDLQMYSYSNFLNEVYAWMCFNEKCCDKKQTLYDAINRIYISKY